MHLLTVATEPKFYYCHTRPETDPCKRNKRMTICCIVDRGKMSFGICKTHQNDVKLFRKDKGRMIAEGRAEHKPILVIELPKTKKEFHDTLKKAWEDITTKYLRSEKEIQLMLNPKKRK